MFERDRQVDNYSSVNSDKETVLGEDTRFKGSLEFSNKLLISGYFEGNLTSKGNLWIGKNGQVKAEIKVGSITIEGKVWGNILADDKIELRSSAELYGDIKANRLTINEGATFIGKCDVNPNRKESKDSFQPSQQNIQDADKKKFNEQQQQKPKEGFEKDNNLVGSQINSNINSDKAKEPLFGGSSKY